MSYFNQKSQGSRTTNLAGGAAYKESEKLQLASILLTSFGGDKFYQTHTRHQRELETLIAKVDKLFVAKAICFARKVFGMRTITHFAASVLAQYISGESWAKDFFASVVNRPDDMTEIIACTLSRKQKVSNAMKKGFAKALGNFTEYQLAKYRGEGNAVKLVDVVNLCHPVETAKNNGAIFKLVKGELRSAETWESMLTAAGSDNAKKEQVWYELLSQNKLGYMALLRNLRNIAMIGKEQLLDMACQALVNETAIKKSLILPFRFVSAYETVREINSKLVKYVNKAAEIACNNIPKLDGKTLIMLDVSGSMQIVSPIASLFAAALLKTNDCDLITYATRAEYKYVNTDDSLLTIQEGLSFVGGGTNLVGAFELANTPYDRIIILSDMQSWYFSSVYSTWLYEIMENPSIAFNKYKQKYACNPKVYSIDLAGYGSLELPEQNVYCLAGFSEKIFDLINLLEEDKNALVNTINAYKI